MTPYGINFSTDIRVRVTDLYKNDDDVNQIDIIRRLLVSKSIVSRTIQLLSIRGTVVNLKRGGPRRKTSDRTDKK